jgi:hypothetical protein
MTRCTSIACGEPSAAKPWGRVSGVAPRAVPGPRSWRLRRGARRRRRGARGEGCSRSSDPSCVHTSPRSARTGKSRDSWRKASPQVHGPPPQGERTEGSLPVQISQIAAGNPRGSPRSPQPLHEDRRRRPHGVGEARTKLGVWRHSDSTTSSRRQFRCRRGCTGWTTPCRSWN